MKLRKKRANGFLVLEILIAGLILTSSIAATMYLFRMGSLYLDKANKSNVVSSKLVQASGLFKMLELEKATGTEDLGGGVLMTWKSQLIASGKPPIGEGEFVQPSLHELLLYRIDFDLRYQDVVRTYQINVFRSKPLLSEAAEAV